MKKIKLISHGGWVANSRTFENSIESILNAKNFGTKYIEFDILFTKDNVAVIKHDNEIMKNGMKRKISDLNYFEILTLVDTLENLCEKIKDDASTLYIFDIKSNDLYGDSTQQLDKIIKNYPNQKFMYSSFNHNLLYSVCENVTFGYLIEHIPTLRQLSTYEHKWVGISHELLTKDIVEFFHKNGKEVYAYTVNDETTITKMIECNVDGIFTDNIHIF